MHAIFEQLTLQGISLLATLGGKILARPKLAINEVVHQLIRSNRVTGGC